MKHWRLVPLTTVVLLLVAIPASARIGSGVVTPYQVGPLAMDGSQPADVQAFAGRPDRVTFSNDGSNDGYLWKTYHYKVPHGGVADYSFFLYSQGWYLEQFSTSLQRFRTDHGTRVGMSAAQAKRREHLGFTGGCIGGGLWRFRQHGHYAVLVDLGFPPTRVVALDVLGPMPLPC